MAGIDAKNFNSPDETRPFRGKGQVEIVNVGNVTAGRGSFEPGWRWSENVKPIAQTDSCQAVHVGYVVSGRMTITMNDGSSKNLGPGDVFNVAPGHDAWVEGNEPCIMVDFGSSISQYAKPS